MKYTPFFSLLAFILCFIQGLYGNLSQAPQKEEQLLRSVHLHLSIHDPASALEKISSYLQQNPYSLSIEKERIHCWALLKKEPPLLKALKNIPQTHWESDEGISLLEEAGIGILLSHTESSSPEIRAEALLALFLSKHPQGIIQIRKQVHDSNGTVRAMAYQLAGLSKDANLLPIIIHAAKKDASWIARAAAIEALGQTGAQEGLPVLYSILDTPSSSDEEKQTAVLSIVHTLSSIQTTEIETLIRSPRAFLRVLGCYLASYFQCHETFSSLVALLSDPIAHVRVATSQALSSLKPFHAKGWEEIKPHFSNLTYQNNDILKASLYQLMLIHGDDTARHAAIHKIEEMLLYSPSSRGKALAASISRHICSICPSILVRWIQTVEDPYAVINLCLGFIYMQQEMDLAKIYLEKALKNIPEKMMWEESGFIRFITPSTIPIQEDQKRYPEAIDQMARLELWQILVLCGSAHIKDLLKKFLKEHTLGITSQAATFLIQEGDEESLAPIQELLQDSSMDVQIQAALILSLIGKQAAPLNILQQHYKEAQRPLKELILQGISIIGSKQSIPFLLEVLNEPFPSLRIKAASALLQCIN